MNDENREEARDPSEPAPAAEPTAATPDAVKTQLQEATGLDIADAVKWLGKVMPKATAPDGTNLPGVRSLDFSQPKILSGFLTKPEHEGDRRRLKLRVSRLLGALESAQEADEAIEALDKEIEQATALSESNQKQALEALAPLERSYRMLAGFFANAERQAGDKIDAYIYNADPETLTDPDDPVNLQALTKEVSRRYRAFGMDKAYGILVVPGWQADVQKIEKLATIGYENKLLVVTDGPDKRTHEELLNEMELEAYAGLQTSDKIKRNIIMLGNWILARSANKVEDEDLYLSPSAYFAGKMVQNDHKVGLQQPTAGFDWGKLQNANGTRFSPDKTEASPLVKKGMNLIVPWDGMCRVWGDASLSTETLYESYPIVRTEDWIVKNVLNFLTYQTFRLMNPQNKNAWQRAIRKFLNEISDPTGKRAILKGDASIEATKEEMRQGKVNVNIKVEYQKAVRYFMLRVEEDDSGNKDAELESSTEAK